MVQAWGPIIAGAPPLLPLFGALATFGVRAFRVGRELEETIEDTLERMEELLNAPKPPPPEAAGTGYGCTGGAVNCGAVCRIGITIGSAGGPNDCVGAEKLAVWADVCGVASGVFETIVGTSRLDIDGSETGNSVEPSFRQKFVPSS